MLIEQVKELVSQGSLNYYSKNAEIICAFQDFASCGIDLYIDRVLKDTVTISHSDPKALLQLIKDTVEILKERIYK